MATEGLIIFHTAPSLPKVFAGGHWRVRYYHKGRIAFESTDGFARFDTALQRALLVLPDNQVITVHVGQYTYRLWPNVPTDVESVKRWVKARLNWGALKKSRPT